VMAVTALRGKIDLMSFEEEYLASEKVRTLMTKLKVSASTDLDRQYPKYWPGRVTVRLIDGQAYSEEVIIPKGESGNPMTPSEVEEKFLSLAAPVLGDEKARTVVNEVYSLGLSGSLGPLLATLK
jgi:2-methylcitrate dehydratase PrpD